MWLVLEASCHSADHQSKHHKTSGHRGAEIEKQMRVVGVRKEALLLIQSCIVSVTLTNITFFLETYQMKMIWEIYLDVRVCLKLNTLASLLYLNNFVVS